LPYEGPKSLDFQGPTLTMALIMDTTRLKIITSRVIKTTDIIIRGKSRAPIAGVGCSQSQLNVYIPKKDTWVEVGGGGGGGLLKKRVVK
jgi:hypothetical protein